MTGAVLSGYDGNLLSDSDIVLIGNIPAGRTVDTSGSISVIVPVFFDSSAMWAATGQSLSVAIIGHNGDTLAFSDSAFTLTDLLSAEGTTARVLDGLTELANALHDWSPTLLPHEGEEQMLMAGSLAALDSVINGSDSLSLKSSLTRLTADPDTLPLAFMDAVLASSGLNDRVDNMTQAIVDMTNSAPAVRSRTDLAAATELIDTELAYRMEAYKLIHELGRTFIGPTSQQFSLAAAPISIFTGVPAAAVIGAALSAIDFITNKLVVAMLPATIDDMKFDFVLDTIVHGELSNTIMRLEASNDPPPISFFDLFNQIVSGMGLAGASAEMDVMKNFLFDILNYFASVMGTAYQAYSAAHPGLPLDPNITSIPDMSWTATVSTPSLYELRTFTPNIVTPELSELEWASDQPTWGDARVYAVTTAGAFGEQIGKTETITITVQPKLVLALTMPGTLQEANFSPMVVRAGYEVPVSPAPRDGSSPLRAGTDTVWSSNVDLDLHATGGTIETSTGLTNSSGEYTTGVKLAAGSTQITVAVNGTGEINSKASIQEIAGQLEEPILVQAIYGNQFQQSTPNYASRYKSRVTLASSPSIGAAGATVTWTCSGGTINPINSVSDGSGYATYDLIMDAGFDSVYVYAKADGGNGNLAYDTSVVHSYCWPTEACTETESGSGTYSATGDCLGGTVTASAGVGSLSGAEIRTTDRISVIAGDSAYWGREAIVVLNVSYSWSLTGGHSGGGIGIDAEISTPGNYPSNFIRYSNTGADYNETGTIEIPIRVYLSPWGQTDILGRYRVTANPDPNRDGNSSISNSLTVHITGISKVLLDDGGAVELLCLHTSTGLSYSP